MKSVAAVFSIRNRTLMNYALLALVLAGTFLYAYNLNATVKHVVERRMVEREIAEVNTRIAELQYEFTTRKNAIDFGAVDQLGLREADDVVFVTRVPSTEGLTINTLR